MRRIAATLACICISAAVFTVLPREGKAEPDVGSSSKAPHHAALAAWVHGAGGRSRTTGQTIPYSPVEVELDVTSAVDLQTFANYRGWGTVAFLAWNAAQKAAGLPYYTASGELVTPAPPSPSPAPAPPHAPAVTVSAPSPAASSSGSSGDGGTGGNAFLQCVAQNESGGDPTATNSSGASGLFQDMPSTWDEYGGQQYAPTAAQATPQQQWEVNQQIYAASGSSAWRGDPCDG